MSVVEDRIGAVASLTPLAGGDVAQAFAVDLADGRRVFAKTHVAPPPGFFSTEASDLAWLAEAGAVNVPRVLTMSDDPPVLVLRWITVGRPESRSAAGEAEFGRSLAELHRYGATSFGRSDGRPTGSRRLPNDVCETWTEFYATRRLLPLARLAAESYTLDSSTIAGLERIAKRLEDLVGPAESASLLHGDLWAGNRLIDASGASWLIDPACFGGHREFDLAMMRLFGGFGEDVFGAYDESWPLAAGHQERVQLYQLAPLVVHAIKFGGGYVDAAAQAVARYV